MDGVASCRVLPLKSAPYLSRRALAIITLKVQLFFVSYSVNKTLWFILKKYLALNILEKFDYYKKKAFLLQNFDQHVSHITFFIPLFVYDILFSVWKLVIMVIIVRAHKVSQILWWQGKHYDDPVTACYGRWRHAWGRGLFHKLNDVTGQQCMPLRELIHCTHTHARTLSEAKLNISVFNTHKWDRCDLVRLTLIYVATITSLYLIANVLLCGFWGIYYITNLLHALCDVHVEWKIFLFSSHLESAKVRRMYTWSFCSERGKHVKLLCDAANAAPLISFFI